MASNPFSTNLLFLSLSLSLLLISLFFSPAHSVTCNSQKLPHSPTFQNCTDLSTLNATLQFTYNATNSSLAVAFSAAPATPDGWVAWGINPSGRGMVGAQALIAFKLNGKITVQFYNLASYKGIDLVKNLSFDTWDVRAVDSDSVTTIFAAVKLPEKADNISQVWQVGPVMGGKPMKHEFMPANLHSNGTLALVSTIGGNNSTNTSGSSGNSNSTSGGAFVMGQRFGSGFYLGLFLALLGFMSM